MKFKLKNKSNPNNHKQKLIKKRKKRKFTTIKSLIKKQAKEKEKETQSQKIISDNNIITIKVKIEEEDINQKIYLLCKNTKSIIYEGENDYIKNQLNEEDIKIYLEEEGEEKIPIHNNYNMFPKMGDFNLKIKFNTIIKKGFGLFSVCENITHIDFTNFNTSLMTDFSYMFFRCYNLKYINLSSFDTSKMTNMKYMFYGCQNLKEINLKSFDTTNVVDATGLFGNCKTFVNLDISNFNFKNIKDIEYMFLGCDNLENIVVNEQLFNQIGEILKNYNITIICN
jgi:surface protein